jgi:hypothetical protein
LRFGDAFGRRRQRGRDVQTIFVGQQRIAYERAREPSGVQPDNESGAAAGKAAVLNVTEMDVAGRRAPGRRSAGTHGRHAYIEPLTQHGQRRLEQHLTLHGRANPLELAQDALFRNAINFVIGNRVLQHDSESVCQCRRGEARGGAVQAIGNGRRRL